MKNLISQMHVLNILSLFGLILFVTCSFAWPKIEFNYYVNFTNSAPIGIYKKTNTEHYKKGDLIVFNLPTKIKKEISNRPWYKNTTLLKQINGLEGDVYTAKGNQYHVNDVPLGIIADEDLQGKPIPHISPGKNVVRKNHFLALSLKQPNSFDSRYYGDISIENIDSKVIPYIIFIKN